MYTNELKMFSNKNNFNIIIVTFLISWVFEWFLFLEPLMSYNTHLYLFYPFRVPAALLICFLYWAYLWGISIWRRTQYGRFTRGDRTLWAKSFVSFWIVEITTILGIFIAACWMSNGPLPLIPRYINLSQKGFLIELTIFIYITWLIYLIRVSLKWQLWKTQYFLTTLILLIIAYLIWRDILTLYGRDLINIDTGSRWKFIKLTSIIYSFDNCWWLQNYMGDDCNRFNNLNFINWMFNNNVNKFNLNKLTLIEYEKYLYIPYVSYNEFYDNLTPLNLLFNKNYSKLNILNTDNYSNLYIFNNKTMLDSDILHSRRIGYVPKKLAIWNMFIVLKIWHHFMLFIWWFFYLLKLNYRKKSSYSLLSLCYFNVYCCFLILFLIYIFNQLPYFEMILKFRPPLRRLLYNRGALYESFIQFFGYFTFDTRNFIYKDILEYYFYNNSRFFKKNFIFIENIEESIEKILLKKTLYTDELFIRDLIIGLNN